MARSRGFTLVELMIVVAIIAILAAIAVPAYLRYGYRARRVDGQQLLLTIANAEERYYAVNNQYTTDPTKIGFSTTPAVSNNGYYSATITPASGSTSAQTYLATATPQSSQANDVCGPLSIDNTGAKLPSTSNTTLNSNGNCW
ncbi:type IV pilin protein [Dyella sp.]|uniref:type IV pilin protein n=1 Tax=Dyella sp. TaxID=1869338 RepID=UPI002FDB7D1C